MRRLHFTFGALLVAALLGCSSRHDVLSRRDDGGLVVIDGGANDAASGDGGGGCPTGEAAECHAVILEREGETCCEQSVVMQECRDNVWRCPAGTSEASGCATLTNRGVDGCGGCRAMEAASHRTAADCFGAATYEWAWDGRACRGVGLGCGYSDCVGADCGALYSTEDACTSAYDACGAGACEAQDVREPTDLFPCDDAGVASWWWNGWACQRFVGCHDTCRGDDCEARFATREACESAYGHCTAQCDAVDAVLVPCEGVEAAYYVWNGHDCEPRSGCEDGPECEGTECDQVYGSLESCRADNRHCAGPVGVRSSLTCDLDEDELVQAALRLGACGEAKINEVIASYFELRLAIPFVESLGSDDTLDCSVARCGRIASSCAELTACLEARGGDSCEPGASACLGEEIRVCSRGLLVPAGNCAAVSGVCEAAGGGAGCVTPGNPSMSGLTTWCDDDELVVDIGDASVRLSCAEHLPGTECREIRYGGEHPGVVCGYAAPTCSEYLTSHVSCDGDNVLLCVGGRERRADCVAAGYARCEDGVGCVEG